MEYLFAEPTQELLISSLPMTASFFAKQKTKNAKILSVFSINMKQL